MTRLFSDMPMNERIIAAIGFAAGLIFIGLSIKELL